jgi:hypothetical protein
VTPRPTVSEVFVVHTISEQAKAFYLALGFDPSPGEPMTLMVTLADMRELLG